MRQYDNPARRSRGQREYLGKNVGEFGDGAWEVWAINTMIQFTPCRNKPIKHDDSGPLSALRGPEWVHELVRTDGDVRNN